MLTCCELTSFSIALLGYYLFIYVMISKNVFISTVFWFLLYLQGLRTMTTCAPSLIRTLMQFSSVLISVDQRLWRMCLGRYADFKDICSSVWIVYTIVYKLL